MSTQERRLLVTAALPYANGDIHIGHLVEYVQTDIWCRYQRLIGNDCLYLCADDAHGTPIMLRARQEGISPQALIDDMQRRHQADFKDFLIQFDEYHSTHSQENRAQAEKIYCALRDAGHIHTKTIEQAYDPEAEMFLPDRFIRGTCPRCKAVDQYGDSCEVCGATYSPSELLDAVSVVSGKAPVTRESEHYFFRLADFQSMLEKWTAGGHMQPEVFNKLKEWFDSGLQDWDISRDAPYWGFEIPGTTDKFFYVWLDAPVGYMATTQKYCDTHGRSFDEYWGPASSAEVHHFIGKDIAYFHTLFWPAMLHGSGYRTPTAVYCHGFLTVDGRKMSKSRGTFISARTYLDHLNPEYLRYYFAAKLNSGLDDIDLNLEDFVQRVNSDLVGKLVNIASRCAGIIGKRFDRKLSEVLADSSLFADFVAKQNEVAALYEAREYSKVVRTVMALADTANHYIDGRKPWSLVKEEATRREAQEVCTQGLNFYKVLITYLQPIVPRLFDQSKELFPCEWTWQGVGTPMLGESIEPFKPLIQRVEAASVAAMVEASTAKEPVKETASKGARNSTANPKPQITIEDFQKIDLRIATVVSAQEVEGSKKLLRLTVDLGGIERSILAGIRSAYEPAAIVGRQVVVVANLAPRKMRFGTSEGMVVVASSGDSDLFLISPDAGGPAGMQVS